MITSAVTLKKVRVYTRSGLYRSVFILQTNWRLPRKLINVLNNLTLLFMLVRKSRKKTFFKTYFYLVALGGYSFGVNVTYAFVI